MRRRLVLLALVALVTLAWRAGAAARAPTDLPAADGWTLLPSGLERGVFTVDPTPVAGDGRLVILRVDPERFALRLVTRSATGRARTARGWLAEDPTVLAAINPSMYGGDQRAVALLVADGVADQPAVSADNSVLAFGGDRPPHLVDRTCEPFTPGLAPNLVQGIRMYGCGGNRWTPQPRRWSEAAVGEDDQGRLLLVFARTPWPMHDFVAHVAGLGIGLTRLQHGDGGPPAQLAWRDGDAIVGQHGSWESGVREDDLHHRPIAIPNLLGVVAR